jgi:hypothetical protein
VAISPDVVSFVHHGLGSCDLRRGGGIHDVARGASCINLAARALQCSLSLGRLADDGSPWPIEPSRPRGYFNYAASADGFTGWPVGSSFGKETTS